MAFTFAYRSTGDWLHHCGKEPSLTMKRRGRCLCSNMRQVVIVTNGYPLQQLCHVSTWCASVEREETVCFCTCCVDYTWCLGLCVCVRLCVHICIHACIRKCVEVWLTYSIYVLVGQFDTSKPSWEFCHG